MKQKSDKSRREFLKGTVAAGGAAAVVAATGSSAVMAADETVTVNPGKKVKGYQETQHIRDYYDSLRS